MRGAAAVLLRQELGTRLLLDLLPAGGQSTLLLIPLFWQRRRQQTRRLLLLLRLVGWLWQLLHSLLRRLNPRCRVLAARGRRHNNICWTQLRRVEAAKHHPWDDRLGARALAVAVTPGLPGQRRASRAATVLRGQAQCRARPLLVTMLLMALGRHRRQCHLAPRVRRRLTAGLRVAGIERRGPHNDLQGLHCKTTMFVQMMIVDSVLITR